MTIPLDPHGSSVLVTAPNHTLWYVFSVCFTQHLPSDLLRDFSHASVSCPVASVHSPLSSASGSGLCCSAHLPLLVSSISVTLYSPPIQALAPNLALLQI